MAETPQQKSKRHATERLVAGLPLGDEGEDLAAENLLDAATSKVVQDFIVEELNSNNPDTRHNAVRKVGNANMTWFREGCKETIRQLAESDPDEGVRQLAKQVLDDLGG